MILNRRFWLLFEHFADLKSCLWCSKKFKEPWLSYKNNQVTLSGDIAFHWQDTHGIDYETLEALMEERLFDKVR